MMEIGKLMKQRRAPHVRAGTRNYSNITFVFCCFTYGAYYIGITISANLVTNTNTGTTVNATALTAES